MLVLDKYLQALDQVVAFDHLQELIVELRDQLGIDHVVYHRASANGEQYGFGTYDPNWVERYAQQDYIRIDPVIIECLRNSHPMDWRRVDWTSKTSRDYRAEAISYGVGNQGFSLPVHGPNGQLSVLTASHSTNDASWYTFIERHQKSWILLAHYVTQKAIELENRRIPKIVRTLSPRETDALTYLGMGYSRSHVATMLSISEHTLRAYIESARFKLGSLNTTHAVARAVSEGLITVGGDARVVAGRASNQKDNRPAMRSVAR